MNFCENALTMIMDNFLQGLYVFTCRTITNND